VEHPVYRKTGNRLQMLGLFFFVLVLALPAWATNFGCARHEIFRSRNLGKKQKVTTLNSQFAKITFSNCHTTSGTHLHELAANLLHEFGARRSHQHRDFPRQ